MEEHSRGFGEIRELIVHVDGHVLALDQKVDGSRNELGSRIDAVDQKVDWLREELVGRIDGMDDRLNGRIDSLDHSLNARIDALDRRFDTMDQKMSQKWTRNFGQRYKVDSAQMRGPYDDGKTTECFSGL